MSTIHHWHLLKNMRRLAQSTETTSAIYGVLIICGVDTVILINRLPKSYEGATVLNYDIATTQKPRFSEFPKTRLQTVVLILWVMHNRAGVSSKVTQATRNFKHNSWLTDLA